MRMLVRAIDSADFFGAWVPNQQKPAVKPAEGTRAVVHAASSGAQHDASEAQGTSGALKEIASYSEWLFVLTAFGLIAYGVYQFINARYRVIDAT